MQGGRFGQGVAAAKQAAFGAADECRLIGASPHAAGRGGRGVFYFRPDKYLGRGFAALFKNTRLTFSPHNSGRAGRRSYHGNMGGAAHAPLISPQCRRGWAGENLTTKIARPATAGLSPDRRGALVLSDFW